MSVIHLSSVAGRTTANIVDQQGALHSMWLTDLMAKQIAAIIAEGDGWPHDAQFKVETKYHTWPMGWDKDVSTNYFSSLEEKDAYINDLREWARCEDNAVRISVWEWDLGPTFMGEQHYG